MSDAYCNKHWIGYSPELSPVCPYCSIEVLKAETVRLTLAKQTLQIQQVQLQKDLTRVIANLSGHASDEPTKSMLQKILNSFSGETND